MCVSWCEVVIVVIVVIVVVCNVVVEWLAERVSEQVAPECDSCATCGAVAESSGCDAPMSE